MILSAIAEKLKRRSKDDFKGRHFEAALILQAVSWYLRYPLSYRDIEELFRERGLEVDHSTLNRWVLADAPLIERRLRVFRKPPCGSIRIDETYIKIRSQWRYLYRAIDKHGAPVDFLLTAKRDLEAAKRFFRSAKAVTGVTPDRVTTDGHDSYPRAIRTTLGKGVRHRTSRYLNNRLEQDHRGIKGRYRSMRGFKCPRSAARFCRAYDELRNFLRPRSRPHQHVPADRRRLLHLRRTATVLAILQAA